MDIKQDFYICCIKINFKPKDTHRLKVRVWEILFHANGNQRKVKVTLLISDQIDFKINTVIREKKGHYIILNEAIQEEGIAITNIYDPI